MNSNLHLIQGLLLPLLITGLFASIIALWFISDAGKKFDK